MGQFPRDLRGCGKKKQVARESFTKTNLILAKNLQKVAWVPKLIKVEEGKKCIIFGGSAVFLVKYFLIYIFFSPTLFSSASARFLCTLFQTPHFGPNIQLKGNLLILEFKLIPK